MKLSFPKEAALLLLFLGGALMLLVFTAGGYVYNKHQWASQRLNEFEPRYARIAGLARNSEGLEQALTQSQAMQAWYLHPPGIDSTQTGNEAQQRIRSLLTSAGMTVVSSQVLPIKQEQGLERIPLAVRADGDIVSLQAALAGLAEQKPALLVDDLQVTAHGPGHPAAQRLIVQFNLLILRPFTP